MFHKRSEYFFAGIPMILCSFLFMIPLAYLLCSIMMLWLISTHSWNNILDWYSEHWPNAVDRETIAQKCFTPAWYQWITAHHLLLMVLVSFVLLVYIFYAKKIWTFFTALLQEIKRSLRFMVRTFTDCGFRERIFILILFGCIIGYRVYFFLSYPPLNDESFSYLYFARQGFFLSAVSYPTTNNHVLYNLVCSLINRLPFFTPMLVMRLPSMIGDLFLFWAVFCLFKRFGNFQRAFAVVAGTAFCFMLSFYATQGRGYQWQEVCTLVSVIACWSYFLSNGLRQQFGYPLFICSSILGFYINPTFAYQFFALLLMAFFVLFKRKDYQHILIFARAVLIIFAMVLLLYLPLIIASSWDAFMHNEYVSGGKDWTEFFNSFSYFQYGMNYVFNLSRAGIFIGFGLIIASLFLYFTDRLKGNFYDLSAIYFIATVLSFLILTLYKKVYPYERLFCSWALFLNIAFINVCMDLFKKYFFRKATLLISLFLVLKITLSLRLLYWDRYYIRNQNAVKTYNTLLKDIEHLPDIGPGSLK